MIALIYGVDELGKQRRLRRFKEEADDGSGMLESNMTVINGRDAKPDEIVMQAMAVPFLAPKRLVIVEDILSRFRRSGPEGANEARESRANRQFQPLFEAMKNGIPESTMLVFTGQGAGERHPFIAQLKQIPGAIIEEYPELIGDNLYRWIREEGAMLGIKFRTGRSRRPLDPDEEWQRPLETDPAILLANLNPIDTRQGGAVQKGGNALAIASELEKLSIAAMGREVTVDDVDVLCGGQRQVAVWTLTDSVLDGRPALAMQALQAYRQQGNESQSIIGTLAASYRIFATVLDMLEDGASEEAIGQAIRRNWTAGRQMAIRRARTLGPAGLRTALEAIVAADRSIKAGEVDEDLATEILVMQLARLSMGQARRK